MKDIITKLIRGQDLEPSEMEDVIESIVQGNMATEQIIAFLSALSDKGESAREIAAAAKVLRRHAENIQSPYDSIDCCGTGGDAKGTYNISTAVAIVSAACGIPVAKHGNRASSSKSGTADVLEAMGVNLVMPKDALETALVEYGFAFLMAPQHHKAMVHVREARQAMGRRTIFNILGPLLNPAGTRIQLLGVYDETLLHPMAEALRLLGSKRALVVHGTDGLDEVSISAPTKAVKLDDEGQITEMTLKPDDFGLEQHDISDIKGGDAAENAIALRGVLEGQKGAYRDIVLANTACVLSLAKKCENYEDGVRIASQIIDGGLADDLLKDYITFSRQYIENE